VWVLVTGAVIVLPQEYSRRAIFTGGAVIFGVIGLATLILPLITPGREREVRP